MLRPTAIKILEEDIRQGLHNIRFSNNFQNRTPKLQATKEKIDKLDKFDFLKIKKIMHQKTISVE